MYGQMLKYSLFKVYSMGNFIIVIAYLLGSLIESLIELVSGIFDSIVSNEQLMVVIILVVIIVVMGSLKGNDKY